MRALLNLFLLLVTFSLSIAQNILLSDEPEKASYIYFANYCSGENEYNNNSSTSSIIEKPSCWLNTGNDVWLKFTSIGNFVDINVTGNTVNNDATLENPQLAIYLSNDNFKTYEEICEGFSSENNEAEFVNSNLKVGSVYFIRISGSNKGSFKFCFTNRVTQKSPSGDCYSATILADEQLQFTVPSFKGAGNDFNEGKNTCIDTDVDTIGHNTVWYKWICDNDGLLTFTIIPQNSNDDLDFVLFKLPSINDCANKLPIRCMASAEIGNMGLNFNSEDYEEYPGFSSTHDNFVKYVNMMQGEVYALMIENFTSYPEGEPNGFNLDFGGSLKFKGAKACFEISDTLFCAPGELIKLINTSINANRYEWYFGDDCDKSSFTSIIKDTLTISYSDYGIKQIILKAWNSNNPDDMSVYRHLVYIYPPPKCYPLGFAQGLLDSTRNASNSYVYPNPAGDNIYIKTQTTDNIFLEIYDIYGRKVLLIDMGELKINNGVVEVDISILDKGIYFVKINELSYKIVKL
ncbi:MAG: hypothetical protein A2X12_03845 [Bacteroidetes bacterium GWE2_29_8]|nr:MAG: hypothetical protein A2X12_03845 [Bacteroidetes bacterium GWE2_29_8]